MTTALLPLTQQPDPVLNALGLITGANWSSEDLALETPQAAFRAWYHAIETTDLEQFTKTLTPESAQIFHYIAAQQGVTPQELLELLAEAAKTQGSFYLGDKAISEEGDIRVHPIYQDGRGEAPVDVMRFQKIGDEWRIIIDVSQ